MLSFCKLSYQYTAISTPSSTVYIGIAQVTWHQPCTFENSSFHFHFALPFAFEEISVKIR